MHISGTEILNQRESFQKLKTDALKVPKQA